MFIQDLCTISNLRVMNSRDFRTTCKIRFTGCRPDEQLAAYLANKGCDARGDAGVTRDTDILVVPYMSYGSSKRKKIGPKTKVVDYASFRSNPDYFM